MNIANGNEQIPLTFALLDGNEIIPPSADSDDYKKVYFTNMSADNHNPLSNNPSAAISETQTSSNYQIYYQNPSQLKSPSQTINRDTQVRTDNTTEKFPIAYITTTADSYQIQACLKNVGNTCTVHSSNAAITITSKPALSTTAPKGNTPDFSITAAPMGLDTGTNLNWQNPWLSLTFTPTTGKGIGSGPLAPISLQPGHAAQTYSVSINNTPVPSNHLILEGPNTLAILANPATLPNNGNISIVAHDIFGNSLTDTLNYTTDYPQAGHFCVSGGSTDCADIFITKEQDIIHSHYSVYINIQPRAAYSGYQSKATILLQSGSTPTWVTGPMTPYMNTAKQFDDEIQVYFTDGTY